MGNIEFFNSINLQGTNVRNYIQNPISQSQIDDMTGSLSGSSYGYAVYNTTLNLPGWWNGEQFVYLTDSSSINISNLATTGSNIFNGNQYISGNLEVSGDILGNLTGTSSYYNVTESDVTQYSSSLTISSSQITGLNLFTPSTLFNDYGFIDSSSFWNEAYSWGDHATVGYILSGSNISIFDNDIGYTNNTGSVTSVEISGSDGIEVDSGSPITTSGTIALGLNKTTTLAFLNVEDGAEVNDVDSVNGQTGIVVLTEQDIVGTRVSESVATTKNIDLDSASDFHYTMTADTAFTFTNTPTGTQVRRCKLRLTGEFAPNWTQAGLQVFGDDYDGTKWNDVLVEMWLDGTIKGLLIFQQRETA